MYNSFTLVSCVLLIVFPDKSERQFYEFLPFSACFFYGNC
ncbi:MAG: hypothetical protein JWQ40_432 [Segetibacter sp.]|nr:hypothetical protein [Segetibacter sp.]